MLIGAHAHYYLTGAVPDRIYDKGPGYEIADLGRRVGSWQADFAINFLASGMWDVISFGFGIFVYDSIRAWSEGRLFEDPPFERREPHFGAADGGNEPFLDRLAAQRPQQLRLSRRLGNSLGHLTTGLGTTASVLEIMIDGQLIAVFDRRVPYYSEGEVTEGVSLFRQTVDEVRRRRGQSY